MPSDIVIYNAAQSSEYKQICTKLKMVFSQELKNAESKVWHGSPAGSFKAADTHVQHLKELKITELRGWLKQAKRIQWDYKNIVKRGGVLVKVGNW